MVNDSANEQRRCQVDEGGSENEEEAQDEMAALAPQVAEDKFERGVTLHLCALLWPDFCRFCFWSSSTQGLGRLLGSIVLTFLFA